MNVNRAIQIVRAELTEWAVGDLAIDAVYDGGDDYLILYGSSQGLAGDSPELVSLDTPIASVSKTTERVTFVTREEFRERSTSLRLAFTATNDL